MIVGIFNIRGDDNSIERKRIISIIIKGQADMFLVKETKLAEVTDAIAKSFWGSEDIDFSFSALEGMSGGLLTLWKIGTITVLSSFRGNGFFGTKVSLKNGIFYIVNNYFPCSQNLKRSIWKDLLELKQKFLDGEWIFGGDFDVVKKRDERLGRSMVNNNVERMDPLILLTEAF